MSQLECLWNEAALTVLRGFAPWIIYAVVSGFSDDAWRWAAVAAVAAGILLILDDRRRGVKPDAQILEISAVVFFAVVAIVGFATDGATFHKYDSVLSFGWLALTAWVSLAIGKPFTEGIAKREVPQEYWGSDKFRHINRVLTSVWAVAFTATAIVVWVIYRRDLGDVADGIAQALGFILPISFTNWYKGVRRRRRRPAAGFLTCHGRPRDRVDAVNWQEIPCPADDEDGWRVAVSADGKSCTNW